MIDPVETKGAELWRTAPSLERAKYPLCRIKPECVAWVRVLLYLAYKGDAKAIKARDRLFVRWGHRGRYPRGAIAAEKPFRPTTPVLMECFIGINGRRF